MKLDINYGDCVLGKRGTLEICLMKSERSSRFKLVDIKDLAEETLPSSGSHESLQNADKIEGERQRGEDALVLSYLHSTVLLKDGVTLRDFFMMLTRYRILQQINMFVLPFVREFERAPAKGCTLPDVKQLTFKSFLSVDNDGSLRAGMTIVGDYGRPLDTRSSHSTFGLDFIPLDQLLDLPLVIERKCELTIWPKGEYSLADDVHPTLHETFSRGPSLHEFVYTITDELAEYGTPEEREQFKTGLIDTVQQIKKGHHADQ